METYTDNYTANDGKEFEFAVIIETIDLSEATGDTGYIINCGAVKLPQYLTLEQRTHIAESMGVEISELTLEDIFSYGLYAKFEDRLVKTESELEVELNEIRSQIPAFASLCGFYFDKPMNRMGNTGWNFLNGEIG